MKRLFLLTATVSVMLILSACDTAQRQTSTMVDEAFTRIATTDWDRNIHYHETHDRIEGRQFIGSFYLCYEDGLYAFPETDADRPLCVIGIALVLIPHDPDDFHTVLKVVSFHVGYDTQGNLIISPDAFARSGTGPIFNRVDFFEDEITYTYDALRDEASILADLDEVIRTMFLHDGVIGYDVFDADETAERLTP